MFIKPSKVKFWAEKKEKENLAFRTFLKINAEEEELDQHFRELHNELFAEYDCSRCRNCCKHYAGTIPDGDIDKDAEYLGMSTEEFKSAYLKPEETEGKYATIHMPCDFLDEGEKCRLGDCKPENCKKYPYTNQPERLQGLYSVLDAVSTCPVAFEIYERLKQIYHFQYY